MLLYHSRPDPGGRHCSAVNLSLTKQPTGAFTSPFASPTLPFARALSLATQTQDKREGGSKNGVLTRAYTYKAFTAVHVIAIHPSYGNRTG